MIEPYSSPCPDEPVSPNYRPPSPINRKETENSCYGFIGTQDDSQKTPNRLSYSELWTTFIDRTSAHGFGQIPGARGIFFTCLYNECIFFLKLLFHRCLSCLALLKISNRTNKIRRVCKCKLHNQHPINSKLMKKQRVLTLIQLPMG